MIQETPIADKIYKVKLTSGRTWLFMSAYKGYHITEHRGAYCINCGGELYFKDCIRKSTGCPVGNNCDIISLVPANENEIVMFKSKLCL